MIEFFQHPYSLNHPLKLAPLSVQDSYCLLRKRSLMKPIIASTSHTSAPASAVTVASFRTWRGSQPIVAKGPIPAMMSFGERGIRTLDTLLTYTRFPGVLL